LPYQLRQMTDLIRRKHGKGINNVPLYQAK
jgi:hypothetical protein